MKRVLRIFGPGEKLVPGVLVAMAEGYHESSDFLHLSLSLPIQLGMVARRKAHGHTLESEKAFQTLEKNCGPRS